MEVATAENQDKETKQEEEENPLHGDLLEIILSFVPLVDLVAASQVSNSWKRSVSSSLTNFNKVKPWLLAHTQTNQPSSQFTTTTHAFDPRSNNWVTISHQPLVTHPSALRSSHSNFLYILSASQLSFSYSVTDDPLHLTWRHLPCPAIDRLDPIIARVGNRIIVAGGAWDFEDDPLAVEVYDESVWRVCEMMPVNFKESAAATCLSVATNDSEMIVAEKASGTAFSFDPVGGKWRGPFNLRPEGRVFSISVGYYGEEEMIVVGLIGIPPFELEGVGIWRVRSLEGMDWEMIGEAPKEIVKSLKGEEEGGEGFWRGVEVSMTAEGFVYVYDMSVAGALVFCEISSGDGRGWDCSWGCAAGKLPSDEKVKVGRGAVFTCGKVQLGQLNKAMGQGTVRFEVAT